jgi:amidohydrolase
MSISKEIINNIKKEISKILITVTDFRHDLHKEPELGRKEFKAQAKILKQLDPLNMEKWDTLLETDVIQELNIGATDTIGLRADIDAIPVKENNPLLEYCSQNNNMHACGHDGHTAMLIGAAHVLNKLKHHLKKNVRFIFQPGEELICAGKDLVKAGACKNLESVFATHCWPGIGLGQISSKPGILFSCGGHFEFTVKGKACHGAQPHNGINPISAASELIAELEKMHDNYIQKSGDIISVCEINSGFCSNVIPDTAIIGGTFRTNKTERILEIQNTLEDISKRIGKKRNCEISCNYNTKYDTPLVNTDCAYSQIESLVTNHFPAGSWLKAENETKAMEDFAFYLKEVKKGAMFWIGTGNDSPALHSSNFNFPDQIMKNGILLFCLLALDN